MQAQSIIDSIFHLKPLEPVPVKVPEGWVRPDGFTGAVEYPTGSRRWYKDGKLHRDGDQPAAIWVDGSKEWWKDGNLHRDGDLPAYIRADGRERWFKNGVEYTPKFGRRLRVRHQRRTIRDPFESGG